MVPSSAHLTVFPDRVEGCIAGRRAEIRSIPPSATTPCQSPPRASPSRWSRREGRVIRYSAQAAIRSAIASGASMCRK